MPHCGSQQLRVRAGEEEGGEGADAAAYRLGMTLGVRGCDAKRERVQPGNQQQPQHGQRCGAGAVHAAGPVGKQRPACKGKGGGRSW